MFQMPASLSSAQKKDESSGVQLKIHDAQLLRSYVLKNDQQAFAELMHRHGSMVLSVARRLVGDIDLAEDVFQSSFLVLARKSSKLLQHTSLAGWLFEVTTRLSRRAYSQSVRRNWYEKKAIAKPNSETSQLDALIRNEETVAILEAVARLQPVYRHAFVLCYLQGKNRREASRSLDCLPDTLSGRLARAKKILSVRLRQRGVTTAVLGGITSSLATSAVVSQTLMQATLHAVELSRPTSTTVEQLVRSALTIPVVYKWMTITLLASMTAIGSYLAINRGEGQEKHPTTPAQTQRSAVTVSPNAVKVPAALTTTPFSISGVVRDIEGKPVAGSTVFLLGTFLRIEAKADASGMYRFDQVPVPLLEEKWRHENLSTLGQLGKFNTLQLAAKSNGQPFTWSKQFGVKPETRPQWHLLSNWARLPIIGIGFAHR